MAISPEDVLALRDKYKDDYLIRHEALKRLRNIWFGKYWEEVDKQTRSVSSIFKDLVGTQSDVGPDIKMVHNVVKMCVDKYQSFLSPLPQIHVHVEPPHSETRKNQARIKQRFLYGAWAAGPTSMAKCFNRAAWYLPLMGHCYLGIWPDFDRNMPIPVIRSPEHAYPIPSYDGHGEDGVIFSWKVRESSIKRAYPQYLTRAERSKGRFPLSRRDRDPEVELMEYSDNNEFARWADGQKLNGVEHNMGFNLWEPVKFTDVPDEVFGHGAVEQMVQMSRVVDAFSAAMGDEPSFSRLVQRAQNSQEIPHAEVVSVGGGRLNGFSAL